jgi:hypothetical protein
MKRKWNFNSNYFWQDKGDNNYIILNKLLNVVNFTHFIIYIQNNPIFIISLLIHQQLLFFYFSLV